MPAFSTPFLGIQKPLTFNFKPCSHSSCKTCPQASPDQVLNTNSHINFCIYKLTCKSCNFAYIGQTSNALHLRINQHRSNITNFNPSVQSHNNFEYAPFSEHSFDQVIISILDIVINESKYIHDHCTIFPYGLNQIYNHQNMVKSKFPIPSCIQSIYNLQFHGNKNRKRGKKSKRSKNN